MTTPDQDVVRQRRARLEALRLVAARLDGRTGAARLDDPDAVVSALAELAGTFLVRQFKAEGIGLGSARAWVAVAITTEEAVIAETAGKQRK